MASHIECRFNKNPLIHSSHFHRFYRLGLSAKGVIFYHKNTSVHCMSESETTSRKVEAHAGKRSLLLWTFRKVSALKWLKKKKRL